MNGQLDDSGQIVLPNYLESFDDSRQLVPPNYIEWFDDSADIHIIDYGRSGTTPNSTLPLGVPVFDDFRTITIEVGVSQYWGMEQGQLDHKAILIWSKMPGVKYVLCVHYDPDVGTAEYKLYNTQI
ncbi:hypothetical protein THRCLA_23487 [Thraustotheca clavata]|uniref:Uncharacterized protein n=1 Tax=Thraustotheca clavata TaxID=74557 RepID=A0A1V9Y3W9_9STRA|nr:hypothetical protein THRCLA_23487 [Thraustotheca clavata]